MAIIKPFLTPQGYTAEYHRILKVEIDSNAMALQVMFAIYANAQVRDAGGLPIRYEPVTIPFTALTSDPRALIYPMVEAYWNSYLKGGTPDNEVPNGPPLIELKPEATQPPEPAPVPSPSPEEVPPQG